MGRVELFMLIYAYLWRGGDIMTSKQEQINEIIKALGEGMKSPSDTVARESSGTLKEIYTKIANEEG